MDATTPRRLVSRINVLVATCLLVLSAATICRAGIDVELYRGEPFGVGRVTVDLLSDAPSSPWGDDRFAVVEAEGRVMYPVVDNRPVRRILRRFLGIETPWRTTFYFLFRGDEPLELTVYTPEPQQVTAQPEADAEDYSDLMEDWWKATARHYGQVFSEAEYPIVVENYLRANWARRLNAEMPEPDLFLFRQRRLGGTWLSQLTANEAYQASVERDLVLGEWGTNQVADIALPEQRVAGVERSEPPADGPSGGEAEPRPQPPATIEPIAAHVPDECFYLRFGSFTNYLWFRDFLNHWQGDLGNMIVLRSIDRGLGERLQEQIALRESKLARVMGPQVIADVAIIGLDIYLRDGAAMGILFQAKNNFLLASNINGQRSDAADRVDGATEETIKVAGHEVQYLASPDGRLRSYYAQDGDYHLVTTSRRMVERFFAAGQGSGALAASPEFIAARAAMPLERDDTIFLYLSRAFFNNFTSPAYRVELDRRMRSIGEMRTLQLARLAARVEGEQANSVDQLVAADLLPAGFGQRADGSNLVEEESGMRDSVRGTPGWMVPIADVPVDKITRAEAERLARFYELLDDEVGRFVPVVAAFGRTTSDDGQIDHITAEVRVAPYSETRIAKWANMLAPSDDLRVAPIEGDVLSGEVVLDALGQPIHVFGGLRDFRTPLMVRQGEVAPTTVPAEFVRGYLGSWPRPLALLDTFIGPPTGPPDDEGVSRNDRLFDLWTRRFEDFFLFSFKRDVLLEVGPQLAMVAPERPAQIRLAIADPSDKQIATTLSGLGYMRSRSTSASATRFMNSLTRELHVPPAEARELAERLVGGRFVCPLGGEYELVPLPVAGEGAREGSRQLWVSTANTRANQFLLREIPADYEMPLIEWFRGLDAEVLRADDALTLRSNLAMVHQDLGPVPAAEEKDKEGGIFGNLFGGWGAEKKELPPPESTPAPEGDPLPPPEK